VSGCHHSSRVTRACPLLGNASHGSAGIAAAQDEEEKAEERKQWWLIIFVKIKKSRFWKWFWPVKF
jgi:hypothetical protein